MTVGTLTIAINHLVKKGYVERSRSEEDRRVVLVSLSEKGEKAYFHHRMFHRADFYGNFISVYFEGRDMFSCAPSEVPGISSVIFSPQQTTGTPESFIFVMIFLQ